MSCRRKPHPFTRWPVSLKLARFEELPPGYLEDLADLWLLRAGLPIDELPDPVILAEALLGKGAVLLAAEGYNPPHLAMLMVWEGRTRILVRRGVSRVHWQWGAFHELGHWIARLEGLASWQTEETADALGWCLQAPRAVVRREFERHPSPRDLYKAIDVVSPRMALQRLRQLGEVGL